MAAQDGFTIYGQVTVQLGGLQVLRFRYDVRNKNVVALPGGSSPGPGPITVSVNRDGSRFMAGWACSIATGASLLSFTLRLSPTELISVATFSTLPGMQATRTVSSTRKFRMALVPAPIPAARRRFRLLASGGEPANS